MADDPELVADIVAAAAAAEAERAAKHAADLAAAAAAEKAQAAKRAADLAGFEGRDVVANIATAALVAAAASEEVKTTKRAADDVAEKAVPSSAADAAAAAVKAAAEAPRQVLPASGSTLHGRKEEDPTFWCVTHFQYRWLCRQEGVEHECAACSAPANNAALGHGAAERSKPTRAAAGAASSAASGANSEVVDVLRSEGAGIGDGALVRLGDAEWKDLEFQRHAAELAEERQALTEELRRSKEKKREHKAIELLEATLPNSSSEVPVSASMLQKDAMTFSASPTVADLLRHTMQHHRQAI